MLQDFRCQAFLLKESLMDYVPFELERWVRFQKMETEEAYSKQKAQHEKKPVIGEGQGTFREQ